jgi:ABC-type multidrug transport system fused ATPase/permease subunit
MKEFYEMLWEFVKANKPLFWTSVIFLLIVPIRDIVLPLLYSNVISAINTGASLVNPLIVVTGVLVFIQCMEFISDWHDTKLFPKLQAFIRRKVMHKILDKYENSIQDLELGEINSKLIKLPAIITTLLERLKTFLIPNVLLHFSAIILFFWVDPAIGFCLLLTVVVMYYVVIKTPQKCDNITTTRDKAFNTLHEEIDDGLRNLYSIYGANQKRNELARLDKYSDKYNEYFKKTTLCSFKLRSIVAPVILLFIVFLMIRIQQLVLSQSVDLALFVPVFFITLYIINSFMSMDDHLKHAIVEWGIVKSSLDVMQPLPSHKQKQKQPYSIVDFKKQPGIGLQNVTFKFPEASAPVLNNVTLHIEHGESIVILGDIGSGKSTILKMLLGYYTPDSGVVYYDGKTYEQLSMKDIRNMIGYVPQVPVLFNRSIIDNILYGNSKVTRKEVENMLDDFGLLKEFKKHKAGLDTKVGKNGSLLSGGQRQLVWCMRVLLRNPQILILDEPTSSIDEKSKQVLSVMLNKYMENKKHTIVMVTHDPAIMSFATKAIIVKSGQIVGTRAIQKSKDANIE